MTTSSAISAPVRVVVVDDFAVLRVHLAEALDLEPDITVVGLAGSVCEAKTVISSVQPDVAVVDLNLPDGSAREFVNHFCAAQPGLACVIHTSTLRFGEAESLLAAGAATVVLKSLRGTELLDAIRGSRQDPGSPMVGKLTSPI